MSIRHCKTSIKAQREAEQQRMAEQSHAKGLEKQVTELAEASELLKGCIIELAEIIYSEEV